MTRNSQYISLRNALDLIQSGQFFAFKAVTFDAKRKKGGKFIEHRQAKIFGKFGEEGKAAFDAAYQVANPENSNENTEGSDTEGVEKTPRNPHHAQFMTRNVQIFANGHPTARKLKIHLDLLVRVNGKRVLLP